MSVETKTENFHDHSLQTGETDYLQDAEMKIDESKTPETENSVAGTLVLNENSGEVTCEFSRNSINEEIDVGTPANDDCFGIMVSHEEIVEDENDTVNVPVIEVVKTLPEQKLNQMSDSLREIQKYSSDTSSDSSSDDDSEEDSSEESESYDSDSEDEVEERTVMYETKKKPQEESWLSVLGIDKISTELPDISSLDLNDKEEFIHMGIFDNFIDEIVTVTGLPQMPAYDLDTLLFLEEGKKVLGYVIDVMGPVTSPIYIIPMTNSKVLEDLQLQKGTKVYCAPRSKYTKYVLLQELMKIRGSDASWVGDVEVPPEFQDYSDDEQERMVKTSKSNAKRKRTQDLKTESVNDMDRIPGERATTPANLNRNRAQNSRVRNGNHMEGRPSPSPQFRSNLPNFGATTFLQPNNVVVNPFSVANQNFHNVPMMPTFNPSIPPPNLRGPQVFASLGRPRFHPLFGVNTRPQHFNPRGYM